MLKLHRTVSGPPEPELPIPSSSSAVRSVVRDGLPPAGSLITSHVSSIKKVMSRFHRWCFINPADACFLTFKLYIYHMWSIEIKLHDLGDGESVLQAFSAESHHHDTHSHLPDNQTLEPRDQPLWQWRRQSWVCWDMHTDTNRQVEMLIKILM